jgi:ribosomal protein L24E
MEWKQIMELSDEQVDHFPKDKLNKIFKEVDSNPSHIKWSMTKKRDHIKRVINNWQTLKIIEKVARGDK